MTYDPILGVNYTYIDEQPQNVTPKQKKAAAAFAREKSMATKRAHRNNTKQK